MKRRAICLIMALMFIFALFPVVAFASESDTIHNPVQHNQENGLDSYKSLAKNGDDYDLTLETYATGSTVSKNVPLDIVLVVDQSGSMATGDMGSTWEPVGSSTKKWTVNEATSTEQYYYRVNEGGQYKYYPVYAKSGTIYEKAPETQTLDTFGRGHDGDIISGNISSFITSGIGSEVHFDVPTQYYGVDSNGKMHKVFVITVGGFLKYHSFYYYYTDIGKNAGAEDRATERKKKISWFDFSTNFDASDLVKSTSNSVVNSHGGNNGGYCSKATLWNGDDTWRDYTYDRYIDYVGQYDSTIDAGNNTRRNYSWFSDGGTVGGNTNVPLYLPVEGKNDIYYVDSNGNAIDISNNSNGIAYQASDTIYTGVLYRATGTTRLSAMQDAVAKFSEMIAENAESNNIQHNLAVVGFAGNRVPSLSGNGHYNYSGYNSKWDYVNSGLFVDGEFKSYKQIDSFSSTSDLYINRHYFVNSSGYNESGGKEPVVRNSVGDWVTVETGSKKTSGFYEGNYSSLQPNDYKKALVSVNDNDSGYFDYMSESNEPNHHTYVAGTTNGVNDYIDKTIALLGDYGGTYTSYGMTMANQIFKNNPINEDERQRVIVVFTDGEPGGNGYEEAIAGEALSDAKIAKETYGAEIYTVGLFKTDPSDVVESFMKTLSSMNQMETTNVYAGAYGINTTLDPEKTYYFTDVNDGKTYAVTTKDATGASSLGWWYTNTSGDFNTYSSFLPFEDSSDNRTGRTTFYTYNNNRYTATYNIDTTNPNIIYYVRNGSQYYPVKYEYRWYDSDKGVRQPMLSASDSDDRHVQFFELGNQTQVSSDESYYQNVADIDSLENAFKTIAESISGTKLDNSNSKVVDVISNEFDVPMRNGTVSADVSVKTAKAVAFDNEGNPTEWGSPTPVDQTINYSWDTDGKTITVNGFDFSDNYVSKDREGTDKGSKLIITISGLKPNTVGDHVYSNTAASGVYKQDDEGNWEETPTLAFPRPYLDTTNEVFHVQVATYKDGALNEQSKWIKQDYHFTTDGYYKNGEVQPYNKLTLLEKEGNDYKYLYGGLYEDEAFTKPVKAADMRGLTFIPKIGKTYYIKQVDPSYLKVKTIYTSWGDDVVSMYPVTVVDSKNYSEAGLIRDVQKDGESVRSPLSNTDSYDMIRLNYKDGSKIYTSDGRSVTVDGTTYDNPTNLFGVPGYMVVKNETQNGYTGSYQPYWITLDGVKVTGQMVRTLNNTSKVSEMRNGVSDDINLGNIDITEDKTYTEETATPLKVKSMFVSADEEEEPVDNGITLAGYTTSLNGNIAMNFYMDLSDEVAADKDAYMQFTLPGANHTEEVVKLADAKKQVRGGKTYYVFSAGVAAKDMTSDIKAQFVKGDGTKSDVWTYTIKQYCDYIRNHPDAYDEESVALVENMLNYGGYAQTYFKHNTDKMANADLDLALPEVDLDESYDPVVSGECTGLTYQGTSSMLTTTTGLKHYFVIAGDASDYTFKVNGKELQLQSDKTGTYVHVDNIKAKDLSKPTALTVTNKDGSVFTLKYSVYTNVKQVVASESFTTEAKNMMKALYGYGEAAIAYFATRN